jgi:hypothetical protein
MKKRAIAILSFDRFDYLEKVLKSLTLNDLKNIDVYCFQDNHTTAFGNKVANEENIKKCTFLFKKYFPNETLIMSPYNLGIALNLDKAEKLLFEDKKYEEVIFLEDDLVLEPTYISTLKYMFDKFGEDERVGMISAYGANVLNSLEVQEENKSKLAIMHHNWGFGLTRKWWNKRQPLVQEYLDKFMLGKEYRKRDNVAIREWLYEKRKESKRIQAFFEKSDYTKFATSQDGIQYLSTLMSGAIRITCFPNYAKYIGEKGVHYTPEQFKDWNFHKQVIYKGELGEIEDLTDDLYNKLSKI